MAMKSQQKIYVAAAVLAVVLVALFLTQKKAKQDAVAHGPGAVEAALPKIKLAADDLDKITKVEIKNGTKSDVTLEKAGDGGDSWRLTKPVNFPANQSNVKSMLDNMKMIEAKELMDPGKGRYAEFDLGDDKAVHVQAFKGTQKVMDLMFGKSGSRGQMFRVPDRDGVFIAKNYAAYQYQRDVKDWRDRDLLKFEDGNVISITIARPQGTLSVSKNADKWTATFKGKPLADFDPEKVKSMLSTYKSLTAEDFADGKSAEETGLDKPEATVTITLKDNGGTFKLSVGKTSSGTSHYVQKEGSPQIYTLSSWGAEWATSGESKFQKAEAKDAGAKKK
jgi:Domain of unknown function (DUF4340)